MISKKSSLRVADANLNRAREGLRVLEDSARFLREDADLSRKLKRLRHRLDFVSRRNYPKLLAARDSQRDIGARTKETGKRNIRGVLTANFRRSQEALRVLEEFSGIFKKNGTQDFKNIRFSLYRLEKEFMGR